MRPTELNRVIVVVLDGLRPDAIDEFDLCNLRQLAELGASTMCARTVTPSLTWPALTSLLTGVAPGVHGIVAEGVHFPKPRARLDPLPELLHHSGYATSAFMGEIPLMYRGMAGVIARGLGFQESRFSGPIASEVLRSARVRLRTEEPSFIFIHWGDADRVGHEFGWMSRQYGDAARHMDFALGLLAAAIEIETNPNTLLVVLADHGGGGIDTRHHQERHHLNATIPLLFAGPSVRRRNLGEISLLDVPTSIAWSLGVQPPSSYAGRVVIQFADLEAESAVA